MILIILQSPILLFFLTIGNEYKNTEIYDDNQVLNGDNQKFYYFVNPGFDICICTLLSLVIWVANGKFGIHGGCFQEVVSMSHIAGKCHITLSSKDKETMNASAFLKQEEEVL